MKNFSRSHALVFASQLYLAACFVLGLDLLYRWESVTIGLAGVELWTMSTMVTAPVLGLTAFIAIAAWGVERALAARAPAWTPRWITFCRFLAAMLVLWGLYVTELRLFESLLYRFEYANGPLPLGAAAMAVLMLLLAATLYGVMHRWIRQNTATGDYPRMLGALLFLFLPLSAATGLGFLAASFNLQWLVFLKRFGFFAWAGFLFLEWAYVNALMRLRWMSVGPAAVLGTVSIATVMGFALTGSQRAASIELVPSARPGHPGVKNVIMVTFDGLAADRMSLYGNPRPTTPNLDAFAAQSYVFDQMHAESDSTPQSVLAIHTGMHYHTDKLPEHGLRRAGAEVLGSMPEFWRKLGWQAVYGFPSPWRRGDIFTFIAPYNSDYQPFSSAAYGDAIETTLARWSLQHPSLPAAWLDALNATYVRPYLLSRISSFDDDVSFGIDCSTEIGLMQPFAAGLEYLDRRKGESSFLWIHHGAPHEPYCSVPGFAGIFGSSGLKYEEMVAQLDTRNLPIPADKAPVLYDMQLRYEEYMLAVDVQFGRFLNALRTSGRLNDSMIVISADHGQAFGKGSVWNSTRVMYEQTARIPLIIHMPGQTEDQRVRTLAHHVDVMPTILGAVGIRAPDWMDGTPLWQYVDDDASGGARVSVSRTLPTRHGFFRSEFFTRVHTFLAYRWPYKFIYRYYGDNELNAVDMPAAADRYFEAYPHLELYDLERDPGELHNIIDARPDVVDELRGRVMMEIQEVRRMRGL